MPSRTYCRCHRETPFSTMMMMAPREHIVDGAAKKPHCRWYRETPFSMMMMAPRNNPMPCTSSSNPMGRFWSRLMNCIIKLKIYIFTHTCCGFSYFLPPSPRPPAPFGDKIMVAHWVRKSKFASDIVQPSHFYREIWAGLSYFDCRLFWSLFFTCQMLQIIHHVAK